MKLEKANKRDKKRNNKKYGMRVSGASVKLTQDILIKKGAKNENKRD